MHLIDEPIPTVLKRSYSTLSGTPPGIMMRTKNYQYLY